MALLPFGSPPAKPPVSSRSYVYNNTAPAVTVPANTYTNFLQMVDYIDTDGTPLFSYDTTNHRYNVLKTCMIQLYGDLFWNDISAEPTINLYLRWTGPTFVKSWVNFVRGFDYDILPKYGWRFQTPILRFDAGDTFNLQIFKTGTADMTVTYAEVWGVAFAVS